MRRPRAADSEGMTSPASPTPARPDGPRWPAAVDRGVRWSPPRPATPARVVLVVLLALVTPWVAAALGFVGMVELTGCFLGCHEQANEPLGLALLGGAALTIVAAPAVAWGLLRNGRAVAWTLAGMVAAFVVPGLSVVRIAGAATIGG